MQFCPITFICLFAGDVDFDLGIWVRGLKRVVAAAVSGGRGQLENPVRAGLVISPDEWPYQGEVVPIDHGLNDSLEIQTKDFCR